jgi:beta-glucosidase
MKKNVTINLKSSLFCTIILFAGLSVHPQPYPFQNTKLPIEERVNNLVSLLTSEEKLSLLNQEQPAIPRLGIPYFTTWTEGLHGLGWAAGPDDSVVTYPHQSGCVIATTFPQAFGLAHTWDPDMIQKVGAIEAYEARVYFKRDSGKRVTLSIRAPMIDLGRDPRWGRTEESYGEDPYLDGELAKGFVKGLQGNNPHYLMAASTLKHFLANNNEANRNSSSSNFDERNLREYYLVPFQKAIIEANAQSFMTSYNAINKIPASVTPIIKDIIIKEWKFDGMICTDAAAIGELVYNFHYANNMTEAEADGVKAGTSVFVDGNPPSLVTAYNTGLITDADIDTVLKGDLRMRMRLGNFDPPDSVPYNSIQGNEKPWLKQENKDAVRLVTQKSIVLLKNADNMLPLDSSGITSIAVIGPNGNDVFSDWYSGIKPYQVSIVQGLKNKLGSKVNIQYVKDNTNNVAVNLASASDYAIVCVGNNPVCNAGWGTCASPYEGKEAFDRQKIDLDPVQTNLVKAVLHANPKTIVVLVSSFPQSINWINDSVPAILHIAHSSQEQGNAIADVLFGDYNPGGRLSMTWYNSLSQLPPILDYNIRDGRTYMYFNGDPLYPFGYGLSYTTFDYSNLNLSSDSLDKNGQVNLSFNIKNTGSRSGDEVVQLYVSQVDSKTSRPIKELKGFKRITLAPQDTQTVNMTLKGQDLAIWNPDLQKYVVEGGPLKVVVGGSSLDHRLEKNILVISSDTVPSKDPTEIKGIEKTVAPFARLIRNGSSVLLELQVHNLSDVNLRLYDLRGICIGIVSQKNVPTGTNDFTVNGKIPYPGMYIISGTVDKQQYRTKSILF